MRMIHGPGVTRAAAEIRVQGSWFRVQGFPHMLTPDLV